MFCHEAPRRAPLRRPHRASARPDPACRFSIRLCSVRAAGLPAATLFRAYRTGPRTRVGAGAVRAPDCAREPGAGRTSPVRSVGVFSHRCEAGSEAAPRMPLPPDLSYHRYFEVKPLGRIYFKSSEQNAVTGRRRRGVSCDVMRPSAPDACPSLVSGMLPGPLHPPESKRRPRKPPLFYSHLTTVFPMSSPPTRGCDMRSAHSGEEFRRVGRIRRREVGGAEPD